MSNQHDMMAIKIDVSKILKEHLFQGKNGAKYLDAVLIPSPNSQYGDSHFIAQGLPKELREQGKKGPIIGNAKVLGGGKRPQQPRKPQPTDEQLANQDKREGDEDFCPF